MTEKKLCKTHDFQYYAEINDEGWKCCNCQYKPPHDEQEKMNKDIKRLEMKIFGIADDLNSQHFIYISNGSTGEAIQSNVYYECKKAKRFDQLFIVQKIVTDPNVDMSRFNKEPMDIILDDLRQQFKPDQLMDLIQRISSLKEMESIMKDKQAEENDE